MGKRTSDFMALAAIESGAGLGLGLTGLFAQSGADSVPRAHDSSVRVRVLRRNMVVEPGRRLDSSAGLHVVHEAPIVEPERLRVRFFGAREMEGLDREQLERLRAQIEELGRETREMGDLEGLYEALGELEALEDLDLEANLTIDILQGDEDQRRKRRRRGPRRAVEGPQVDPSGN
jgi:hypothetical protein